MSDPQSVNTLLKDFQPSSKGQWTAMAKKELGDDTSLDKLNQRSTDGLHVKPYYDKSDLNEVTLHGFQLAGDTDEFKGARSWDNLPPVRLGDESTANKKALQHLTAGADGIFFDLRTKTQLNFGKLLKSIELEYCHVSFITDSAIHSADFLKYLENSDVNHTRVAGAFFHPIVPLHIVPVSSFQNFKWNGISVPVSTPIDEISHALFTGNQRIQNLIKSNWRIEAAFSSVSFLVSIDTDFFTSISKLKALRFLWFQIAQAYGVSGFQPENLYILAQSHPWIHADFQPHGNMLKETTSAMASILGGANGLTLHPESLDNDVMSRIALNTGNILREESYLNRVADPVAGSYLVENLVMDMAEKGWAKFQTLI